MLDGCHYHLLNSLLPSGAPHEWSRLEYLSAISFCRYIEDFEVASKVLPQTPTVFFKPLFHSAVYNFFYMYDGDSRVRGAMSDSLVNLILFWPSDTFNLREVLQDLPPHYTDYNSKTLQDIRNDLEVFYGKLSILLAKAILQSRQDPYMYEKCEGPLQYVDLSGFIRADSKIIDPRTHQDILEIIEDSNEAHGNKKKINLITDLEFEVRRDATNALNDVQKMKTKPKVPLAFDYKRIKYKFNKKNSHLTPKSDVIEDLADTLANNRPQFLRIDNEPMSEDVTSCLLSSAPYLKGLGLTKVSLTILNQLLTMPYLQQLDLANIELGGHLGALNSKTYRLHYLNLSNCSLGNDDLESLIRSSHPYTLRQLDLSRNHFCDPSGRVCGLILFCKYLKNLEVLDISSCDIHQWNVSVIGQLMESLKALPNVKILNLDHNKFSSFVLMKYVTCLGESESLRYLSVSLPKDIYDWNDPACLKDKRTDDFLNTFRKAIDMNFPDQILHVLDIRKIHSDILRFSY